MRPCSKNRNGGPILQPVPLSLPTSSSMSYSEGPHTHIHGHISPDSQALFWVSLQSTICRKIIEGIQEHMCGGPGNSSGLYRISQSQVAWKASRAQATGGRVPLARCLILCGGIELDPPRSRPLSGGSHCPGLRVVLEVKM